MAELNGGSTEKRAAQVSGGGATPADRLDVALSGLLLAIALETALVRLLVALQAVSRGSVLAGTAAVSAAVGWGCHRSWRQSSRAWELDRVCAAPLALALAVLATALLAAAWLPVWQWDALGYHLPFVNFFLQKGPGIPADDPYVAAYPHHVEYLFLAWRSLLPDDRWVDAAQIPFGLFGALCTIGLARRAGASDSLSVAAGALWLAVPIVFLQLPTNYVDVATGAYSLAAAYFILAAPTRAHLLLACLAIGLLLGAKPSAPPAALVLALVLCGRAVAAGRLRLVALGLGAALALGSEAYLRNLILYHNPVWPVALRLGPWALPGLHPMGSLLASGAHAPHASGPLPVRLFASWLALAPHPAFDMRVGGFGPLFPLVLVGLASYIVRRRALAWLGLSVAALAAPDPAIARYTLALPGLALAATAALVTGWPRRIWTAATALASAVAALGIYQAWPGLSGEGVPLLDYAQLGPDERARAVGAAGPPGRFIDARQRLGKDEAAAYDRSFELPYLLWRSDLGNRVVRIPDVASADEVQRLLRQERIRLLVAGEGSPAAQVAAASPATWEVLFRTRVNGCAVYWRR